MTVKDVEDGHAWRKYGQKEIQNSKYPKYVPPLQIYPLIIYAK